MRFLHERLGIAAEKAPIYAPQWMSWAVFRDRVDDRLIREVAQRAGRAGFAQLMIDDGWQRDRMGTEVPKWKLTLYRILALGWNGNKQQYATVYHALRVLMILIIPVGLSIHTVTSWLFASTLRPGWDSTIFGPYFVIAAVYSGVGVLIVVMWVYRKIYKLDKYLTKKHFVNVGVILMVLAAFFGYFTFSEYLTKWYGSEKNDELLINILFERYFWLFIFSNYIGVLMPLVVMAIQYDPHNPDFWQQMAAHALGRMPNVN